MDYRNLEETGIDAPTGEDDDVQEERNDVAAYLTNGGPAPPVLLYVSGVTIYGIRSSERLNLICCM